MHFEYIAVENIVTKGEIVCNKQFLLFSQCFLPDMALFFILSALENVVCNLFQFLSSGNGFTLFQTSPGFLGVCSTNFLKTPWEKEKLLIMSNFSFSHGVFYPFAELSAIFIKFGIVVCKLIRFGRD